MLSLLSSQGFIVVDGGLATQLEARGNEVSSEKNHLWSAKLIKENPIEVVGAHRDFLEAGADVITSCTYQASVEGFERIGCSQTEAKQLMVSGVLLALQARDEWWKQNTDQQRKQPLVCVSMGCYGAYLADGSEYSGRYAFAENAVQVINEFHSSRVQTLVCGINEHVEKNGGTKPDIWAFETVPALKEAEVICSVASEFLSDVDVWVSFACSSETTVTSGDKFIDCVKTICACKSIVGVGINCTPPEFVSSLLASVREMCEKAGKILVVYPNSGEEWDGTNKCWKMAERDVTANLQSLCSSWFDNGARCIGGCCRVYPHHISALRKTLSTKI